MAGKLNSWLVCWCRIDSRWFMMIRGNSWWFMMIHDESWWITMNHDESRWILMIHDESWWIMMNHDYSWWFMMNHDELRWFIMIHHDSSLLIINNSQWFIMFYDDSWWFTNHNDCNWTIINVLNRSFPVVIPVSESRSEVGIHDSEREHNGEETSRVPLEVHWLDALHLVLWWRSVSDSKSSHSFTHVKLQQLTPLLIPACNFFFILSFFILFILFIFFLYSFFFIPDSELSIVWFPLLNSRIFINNSNNFLNKRSLVYVFSNVLFDYPGSQRSEVVCVEKEAGIVDDIYCNITTKPDDMHKSCNEHLCPAR